MANLIMMHMAFGHLGFSAAAAAAIVNEQAIDSVKELRLLSDKKVQNLCKVVRHPAGPSLIPMQDKQKHWEHCQTKVGKKLLVSLLKQDDKIQARMNINKIFRLSTDCGIEVYT